VDRVPKKVGENLYAREAQHQESSE